MRHGKLNSLCGVDREGDLVVGGSGSPMLQKCLDCGEWRSKLNNFVFVHIEKARSGYV